MEQFGDFVAAAPGHVAVTEGARKIGRGALLVAAHRIAAQLRGLRVYPGAVVAIRSHSPDALSHACDLAVLLCGAVPASVPEQLDTVGARAVLQALRPACLIDTGPAQDPVWATAAADARVPTCVPTRSVIVSGRPLRAHLFAALDAARTVPTPAGACPAGACVAFTASSSGRPRPVLLTEDALAQGIAAWRGAWTPAARRATSTLTCLPASHMTQRIMGHYLLMLHGLTVHTTTPAQLAATIIAKRPHLLPGDPATLTALAHAAHASTTRTPPLRSALRHLRMAVTTTATLPPATAAALTRIELPLAGVYGTADTTVPALHRHDEDGSGQLGDPVDGVGVAVNDEGRLLLRTPYLARRVTTWPDTAPLVYTDGWLHTGDRAAVDSAGRLRLVGHSA